MAYPASGRARVPRGFEGAFAEFRKLPNVGKATAEDLVRLRVRSVRDLARRDPMTMYKRLCRMDGAKHDPCVIDVFMATVEHAKTGESKPWWKYTAQRKAMLAASGERPARATRSKR
jgi:hypothetical protein